MIGPRFDIAAAAASAAVEAAPPQERHYLAKDYASFRALMLDRLAAQLPGGAPADPASLEVALVEALAYVGDYLSYHQDAVATEAYLDTARRRISVARHARLLDYRLDEGCAARVFVQLTTDAEAWTVPADTRFVTRIADVDTIAVPITYATDDRDVFASLHPLVLRQAHNRLLLADERLAAGACDARIAAARPHLAPGDLLILSHPAGWAHPIRLAAAAVDGDSTVIDWHDDDALPAVMAAGAGWTVAGNVLLARQGLATTFSTIDHAREHRVACPVTIFATAYAHAAATHCAAADAMVQPPHAAEPMLHLTEDLPPLLARRAPGLAARRRPWQGRRSLISSGTYDRAIAVEPIDADHLLLRFGDGVHGRRAAADFRYTVRAQVNRGARGNIGPGTLFHIVGDAHTVTAVTNPIAASGGRDPESIADARGVAPVANFSQRRCVTEEDYRGAVLAISGVRTAHVRRLHATTRDHVTIAIALTDARSVSDGFAQRVAARLAPWAMIADVIDVRAATGIFPQTSVTLAATLGASDLAIRETVTARLCALELECGETLTADHVIAAAAGVPGVGHVLIVTLDGSGADIVPPADGIVIIDRDHLTITLASAAA